MDGRARFLDNIFIERLWWSLKYGCVYLQKRLVRRVNQRVRDQAA